MKGDTQCPNFFICKNTMDSKQRVCGLCIWRFNNQILEVKHHECSRCHATDICVPINTCSHHICISKFFTKITRCPECSQV